MAEKIIIGIAGELAAGKSIVTNYLVERYGAKHVRYSAVLEDLMSRLYLPFERKNYANMAEAVRTYFTEDILSRTLAKDVEKSTGNIIIADGIRKAAELRFLRTLPDFYFFFVDADIHKRFERLKWRTEKTDDQVKTFEEFVKDHEHAADNTIHELKKEADFVISNDGTPEALQKEIDGVMQKIEKSS